MQLSTRGRYAVMAMVELAGHEHSGRDGSITLAQIAASQQLSLCYLEQLFAALRRAGLVLSARGPGGGYWLSRPAGEMTLIAIIDAVEKPIRATRCTGDAGCMRRADGSQARCRTHDLWNELGQQIRLFLSGISLADVAEGRVAGRAVLPRLLEVT
jgi:Rrf2 family iron-sulfur cluster assembly transcriptional regulator